LLFPGHWIRGLVQVNLGKNEEAANLI